MTNKLDIYLNNRLVAYLKLENDQSLWEYSESWKADGFAISPHLPLRHPIPAENVLRFFRNLLPEGQQLDEFTSHFHLSKYNTYGFIRVLGLDMPGALVVLPTGQNLPTKSKFSVLENKELIKRLNNRENFSLIIWDEKPRLSVAGVQDKINIVLQDNGRIGFGDEALCSTHILKFEKHQLSHLVLNEYFTMNLAAQCGLEVAKTEIRNFDMHATLLVERFDRKFKSEAEISRYHTIDGCQALNLPPEYKYERNWGNGRDVAHVREGASLKKLFKFSEHCSNPALTKKKMLDWVLFNLLVFNFDAHGKNISFFVSKNGISLAPFYDLVNIKMYSDFDHEMAMALGDEFESAIVNAYQLADFADSCGLPRRLVSKQLDALILKCQKALNLDIDNLANTEQEKSYLNKYVAMVRERCRHLKDELSAIVSIEL